MQLFEILDPRDNLTKARRKELALFAKSHGVKEIEENMPAVLMRKILREKGLTNINLPPRQLGSIHEPMGHPDDDFAALPANGNEPKGVERDADDDLALQWQTQKQQPAEKHPDDMTYWEMYHALERRGVALPKGKDNRLKKHQLRALFDGEDTA